MMWGEQDKVRELGRRIRIVLFHLVRVNYGKSAYSNPATRWRGGSSQATWHHCALLKIMCLLVKRHEAHSGLNFTFVTISGACLLPFLHYWCLWTLLSYAQLCQLNVFRTHSAWIHKWDLTALIVLGPILPKSYKHLNSLGSAAMNGQPVWRSFLLSLPTEQQMFLNPLKRSGRCWRLLFHGRLITVSLKTATICLLIGQISANNWLIQTSKQGNSVIF